MNNWLKAIRNKSQLKEWWPVLVAKLRGHYQYYGVSGNYPGIRKFYTATQKLAFKWINRRSQKKSMTLEQFWEYLRTHPLPKPVIRHNFYTLGNRVK